jgi:exodeoxyribonuclease-1
MHPTYLFYDIETTGRNKCFDQVLQFAAIRTDLELNELERHEIQVKLNCDVIPDPEAILIHHIPIASMLQGESEYDAIQKIHKLLNTPGTISGGYNTLGFDDEFLRFSFHRNLLPPYTHQWANQCGRFDLYPVVQLYFLYHNQGLKWPRNEAGKISLKLENLNRENQLATGAAHTAIVDVEATVALARLLMQNRNMWDYSMGYFNKDNDLKRRRELTPTLENLTGKYQLGLMIGKSGTDDFFQCPVLSLGTHNHYKNQTLWLRLDKPELRTTTIDTLTETSWVLRKRAGEPGFLLPFLPRFIQQLSEERKTQLQTNLDWLANNEALLLEIQNYHQAFKYPEVANVDIYADLYIQGFPSDSDKKCCEDFHQASLPQKVQLIQKWQNPRLKELALRILGRHYPNYLTPELAEQFAAYLRSLNTSDPAQITVDYRGNPRLTAAQALLDVGKLRTDRILDSEQTALLSGLENYLCTTYR